MKNRKWEIAIHGIVVVTLAAFIIVYLNKDYPLVGHDYEYFIPHLIDTLLHYKVNGLTIQWYSPSFAGGVPAYPNPQNIQFSLPQFFTMLMDPWSASVASTVVFALVGYFSMFYFLVRGLSLRWEAGILGGLFFSVNGFFIEHMSAGHLPYQTFALLPLIGIALFASGVPELMSGTLLALVVSILIHEAGFYLVVIFSLSCLLALPILYFNNPHLFTFKRLGRVIGYAGLFTVLLAGSKVYAVYSLMRFFPRHEADHYSVTLWSGLKGLALQLLGTMNLVPLRLVLGKSIDSLDKSLRFWSGTPYGFWEMDVSLSPILLAVLGVGLIYQGAAKVKNKMGSFKAGHWVALAVLVLAIWTIAEFTLARGVIYPFLRQLPILSSMRANPRFASAFIFPLAMLGAILYERMAAGWKILRSPLFHAALVVLTLAGQLTYFAYKNDMQNRTFSVTSSIETYRRVQAGDTFPVETIADIMDYQTFMDQASDLRTYEPLFNYAYYEKLPTQVVLGPVTDVRDGKFNLTNPAGYVFPEENQTTAFALIPATEAKQLYQFTHRIQPDWKRPILQDVLDVLSELGLFTMLGLWVGLPVVRSIKRRRLAAGRKGNAGPER